MRLIATRKVLKTRQRMEVNRPYLFQNEIIKNTMLSNPSYAENIFIKKREVGKTLVILITGDRGLCAGYNVNASKEAVTLSKNLAAPIFVTVGKKGNDYLRRRRQTIVKSYRGKSENPFYEDAQDIADLVTDLFSKKEIDQAYVVYTKYHSMINLIPTSQLILPLERRGDDREKNPDFITRYDSDAESFINRSAYMYVASVIFGAMLESAACEQASRVMGMDAATKNCDKIIETLNLQYNQMRQSAITQEIAEIVGGAQLTGK